MPKKATKRTKKPQHDPLLALKYRGYCRANMPPGEDSSMRDFINFAKFTLCRLAKRLWNDPIWDNYTDEEILIEYYAHLYTTDQVARKTFEVEIEAGEAVYGEEIFDWLDRMVAQNQAEMAQKAASQPDKISFRPGENKDVEE